MKQNNWGTVMRKWFRNIHRELSYFFAGVICIYAISGICLNHKRDFNSNITITRYELSMAGEFPVDADSVSKETVHDYISQLPDTETYTKHSAVGENSLKMFFKGGSSLEVDMNNGKALYEKIRKRPVFSSLNRLHYNPTRWWTWFSDIFAVCLLIITVTGLFMIKGPKGMIGRGGIEFLIGILIPLLFILL
jgi:hypothetical protein